MGRGLSPAALLVAGLALVVSFESSDGHSNSGEHLEVLDEMDEHPSFRQFSKIAQALYGSKHQPRRKLGESKGWVRPEDALSFRPDGGEIRKHAAVHITPSSADVEAAETEVQTVTDALGAASKRLKLMEDQLQRLRWRIAADRSRRKPPGTDENKNDTASVMEDQEEREAEEAAEAAEAAEKDAKEQLQEAKERVRQTTAGAARDFFFTSDGSEPTESSTKYDHTKGIVLDAMHSTTVTLRAIAVSTDSHKVRQVTGRVSTNFTMVATLPQRAQEQLEVVYRSINKGVASAQQTDQFVPLAWEKVSNATQLAREARALRVRSSPFESKAAKLNIRQAKMDRRSFQAALKTHQEKLTEVDELKKAQRVAVRKYEQEVTDLSAAETAFDGSAVFHRSALWTAHIEKREARHRYRRISDQLDMAKYARSITKLQLDREAGELKETKKAGLEAVEIAATALRQEESADDDRIFENKVEVERKLSEAEEEDKMLEISARKEKAAAKEAEAAAAAVAAAADDPTEALSAAREALEGGQLATQKAGAEQANMAAVAQSKELAAAEMQRRNKDFEARKEAARAAIKTEGGQQQLTYNSTLAYLDSRLAREGEETAIELTSIKLAGASLIHMQSQQTLKLINKWYLTTEIDKFQAQQEYLQAQSVSLLWGEELKQRRQIQHLAEEAEAQARRDMLSAEAAKMLAEAAVLKSEASRRAVWRKAFHLETKVKDLQATSDELQGVINEAKTEATETVRFARDKVAQRQSVVEEARAAVKHAMSELEAATAKTKEEAAIDKEQTKMQADGILKSDESKATDRHTRVRTANQKLNALIAASTANATLVHATEARRAAEAKLNTTLQAREDSESRARRIQQQLDQVQQMVLSATNATNATQAAAVACNEYQATATHHAEEANTLHQLAIQEHKAKYQDMLTKQADTRAITKKLSISVEYTKKRGSYLARAEATRIEWEERQKRFRPYAAESKKLFVRAVIKNMKAKKLLPGRIAAEEQAKSDLQAQQQKLETTKLNVHEIVREGCRTPPSEHNEKPAPFMELMTKYRDMQQAWEMKLVHEHARRLVICQRADKRAQPPVRTYTIAQKLEKKAMAFMLSEQDSIVTSNEHRTDASFKWKGKRKKAMEARDREKFEAAASLAQGTEGLSVTERELEFREALYRNASLAALSFRVLEQWQTREGLLQVPNREDEVARAVFERVVGVWERDGTPVGPGGIAEWDMDPAGATQSVDGQPSGLDSGYLNPNISASCSAACMQYAEPECSQGRVANECTRGQVLRARYAILGAAGEAATQSDWFVCRCNQGSMQFAAVEAMKLERQKGKYVRGQITASHSASMVFDLRLREEETIPDKEVGCWLNFPEWLKSNNTLTRTRAALERASFAPSRAAEPIYEEVRKQWYRSCLQRKDDQVPALLPSHFYSSTDASFNVLSMRSGVRADEQTAEQRAAMQAKMAENDATTAANAKLAQEQQLSVTIVPGDAESTKAAAASKDADASVDPEEPASSVEVAAAESEADAKNRQLLLQDGVEAQKVISAVKEEADSHAARINATNAEIREAEIAVERARRAEDTDGVSTAQGRMKDLKVKLDSLTLEQASTLKLMADMSVPVVAEEPPPAMQTPEKASVLWFVGPKAYSSDLPVQPPGVCSSTILVGGVPAALELAKREAMHRVDPTWRVFHIEVPDLCAGQFRPKVESHAHLQLV